MRKNIFTKATMRRAAAFGLAGCMAAASLTGCGSSKTESTTAANAETKVEAEGESKAEAADGSDIHVGIIFTEAGLSGNSFNDLALEGVKKAADDTASPTMKLSQNPYLTKRSSRTKWLLPANMT